MRHKSHNAFFAMLAVMLVVFAMFYTFHLSNREDVKTGFGTIDPSYVLWLSQNAGQAVVVRFDKDTNGDGKIGWRFGDHGELLDDEPSVVLIDTKTSDETEVAEFVATDERHRVALVEIENNLFLLRGDSGELIALDDADLTPDPNRCLPPRSGSVSPDGKTIAYVTPVGVRIFDVATRTSVLRKPSGLLWRVEQTDAATLAWVIEEDTDGSGKVEFPIQGSTCGCWWCVKFARSVGRYATKGDLTKIVMWDADGAQQRFDQRDEIVGLGSRVDATESDSGRCVVIGHAGRRNVLMRCPDGLKVYDSKERAHHALPTNLRYNQTGGTISTGGFEPLESYGKAFQMMRLRLSDQRLIAGPVAHGAAQVSRHGWWLGRTDDDVFVLNMESGLTRSVDLPANPIRLQGLRAIYQDGRRFAVNPHTGKSVEVGMADWIAGNGCALPPDHERGFHRGPIELICP